MDQTHGVRFIHLSWAVLPSPASRGCICSDCQTWQSNLRKVPRRIDWRRQRRRTSLDFSQFVVVKMRWLHCHGQQIEIQREACPFLFSQYHLFYLDLARGWGEVAPRDADLEFGSSPRIIVNVMFFWEGWFQICSEGKLHPPWRVRSSWFINITKYLVLNKGPVYFVSVFRQQLKKWVKGSLNVYNCWD